MLLGLDRPGLGKATVWKTGSVCIKLLILLTFVKFRPESLKDQFSFQTQQKYTLKDRKWVFISCKNLFIFNDIIILMQGLCSSDLGSLYSKCIFKIKANINQSYECKKRKTEKWFDINKNQEKIENQLLKTSMRIKKPRLRLAYQRIYFIVVKELF